MRELYLGIDVGTSGCKAIGVDENNQTVAESSVRYDDSLISNGLGSYDQKAEGLLDAGIECITKLVKEAGSDYHVAALGFTGQMHGLVALDDTLKPLRPVISCVDFRNYEQNRAIHAAFGGEEGLVPYTNNKLVPSCTVGKIVWMMENEPELFSRTRVIVNPKDYVRTALTGVPATDVSDASGFGMFDVQNRCWSRPMIDKLGIPEGVLPPVYDSCEVVGHVLPEMAAKLGITPDAVVIAGAGDAIMQTVGSGAVTDGVYSVILGSGGLISTSLKTCAENKGAKLQLYASALKRQWVAYVGLMSVGTSTNWFKDQFYGESGSFAQMEREAASVPPGSEGLLFFPALLGQRNPVDAPFAKGVVVGLTPAHGKKQLYRAMLEGLTLGMREVYDQLHRVAAPIKAINISGGGAVSDLWCQMFADVFQTPVRRVKEYAVCGAMGAARLAAGQLTAKGVSEQTFTDVAFDKVFEPNKAQKAVYDDLYRMYVQIYPASAPLFGDLKAFEEKHSNRGAQ